MTINWLFTGSRDYRPCMERAARAAVERLQGQDIHIIVGDASGIDALVVREAHSRGLNLTIYTPHARPRCQAFDYKWVTTCNAHTINPHHYILRDDIMVRRAHICVAIWNGLSRGTKHTYEYALKLGKTVYLYHGQWLAFNQKD